MNMMETQEMISALADGQLQGEAFARGVQAITGDPAGREAWQTYHLIGDVLRSGELAAGTAPALFMKRFQRRLAQEPGFAINSIASRAQPVLAKGQFDSKKLAANDASFRWKLAAGFASLTAVAVIGWTAAGGLGGLTGKPEQAQLAGALTGPGTLPAPQAGILANTERGPMIRDARLDELLAAHRQFGGASALQMPSGFLRNATFEGPAR